MIKARRNVYNSDKAHQQDAFTARNDAARTVSSIPTTRQYIMNDTLSVTGHVVSVNRSSAKGESKTPVPEIEITSRGIRDDAHAGAWRRQVSLLGIESIDRFGAEAGRSFASGDFAENITTRGIDLMSVGILDRFTIGDVTLEVTQLGKECHGDGCAIYREIGRCVMPREGIFCRVVYGGVVKAGDTITHLPRPLDCRVITLSDRAHLGLYQDQSGPRVKARLEAFCVKQRWHPVVGTLLLPDDPNRLKAALLEARDSGADIVITTGGTGLSPRDTTPDVVAALADRLIPGIMDYIRITCGARNPHALLSRSVAAVIGRTLVYTLPGSLRAVDEYMDEIQKTLEHILCMLHGVDAH